MPAVGISRGAAAAPTRVPRPRSSAVAPRLPADAARAVPAAAAPALVEVAGGVHERAAPSPGACRSRPPTSPHPAAALPHSQRADAAPESGAATVWYSEDGPEATPPTQAWAASARPGPPPAPLRAAAAAPPLPPAAAACLADLFSLPATMAAH